MPLTLTLPTLLVLLAGAVPSVRAQPVYKCKSSHGTVVYSHEIEPLLGETPAEYELRHKRFKLPSQDRTECATLDSRLPAQEMAVRKAVIGKRAAAEAALFNGRKRYRQLGC